MPSTVPVVSRRRVLAGGAALAALGVVASGCGSPPAPPPIDDLKAQSELARHDSELATAAAAATTPPIATALTEVAAERSRHAQALTAEIARVSGQTTASSQPTSATTSTTASVPAAPAPSLADVVNSLHTSAGSASQLATSVSGYRAGLLGSIAAACTAAYTVALVFGEPTP